jgi:hypothetical protein
MSVKMKTNREKIEEIEICFVVYWQRKICAISYVVFSF